MRSKSGSLLISVALLVGLGCVVGPAGAWGQDTGGLEVGEIVIGPGERPVVLPPARKGEVMDTIMYTLPPGDSLMFGARISNLDGDGGPLPVEGEFDSPLILNAEASIGSYISPRGRVALEYAEDRWNGRALLDLRSTAGHVDGAEASSLIIEAAGEYQIQGELPSPGKARVGAGLRYQGDGYTLFGNSLDSLDRNRSLIGFDLRLTSETDMAFDYDVMLSVEGMGVDDDSVNGGARSISATTPEFGARFRLGGDSLGLRASLRYRNVSLDYDSPTESVDFLEAIGSGEWSPAAGLFVTVGFVAAHGGHSDSGSTSFLMPRGSVRYELSRTLGIYGRFAPELRAASYRSRMMAAPYVDAEIPLRPERISIDLAAGVRVGFGRTDLEGEVGYAEGDNTPVVTLDQAAGVLGYAHVDSRTIAVHGRIRSEITDRLNATGRLSVLSKVDVETDQRLPMTPALELEGGVDLRLTEKIGVQGNILFQGEQNVALDPLTIPAGTDGTLDSRFLIDLGGTWRIAEPFELFAAVTNLLALDYRAWHNYQAPGLEVRVGGRGRF